MHSVSVHPFELLGVSVAPGHHRRPSGEASIGLAKRHIMRLGQLAQLADRHLEEPGVGREGDVLGLHRVSMVTRARSLFFKAPVSWAMRRLSANRMSR